MVVTNAEKTEELSLAIGLNISEIRKSSKRTQDFVDSKLLKQNAEPKKEPTGNQSQPKPDLTRTQNKPKPDRTETATPNSRTTVGLEIAGSSGLDAMAPRRLKPS